jgi:murein DD-endopeptidase MepM/ murein hydrolase activator NlpD
MKFSESSHRESKLFSTRIRMWVLSLFIVAIATFTYDQTAHAGLFSFFTGIVSPDQASADTQASTYDSSSTGSQNMPLLQAASNFNPNSNNCSDALPVTGSVLDPGVASANSASCGSFSNQISTYTVVAGDTISSVAKMFNVSVNTILWANDLTSKSVLQPGQNVVILPVDGIPYTIKKGDSLQSIAKRYGGTHADDILTDILNYNDLTLTSVIASGQKIIIPSAEPLSAESIAPSKGSWSPKCISNFERLLDNISRLPYYSGYYIKPILGGYKSQCLHGHNAVDFAAPVGTAIRASAGGTVIIAMITNGWNGGYGNYVVVKHSNGSQTLYAHMNSASSGVVRVGQHVEQGQTIGYVGMTGMTTGPHVHFEIRGAQNPF